MVFNTEFEDSRRLRNLQSTEDVTEGTENVTEGTENVTEGTENVTEDATTTANSTATNSTAQETTTTVSTATVSTTTVSTTTVSSTTVSSTTLSATTESATTTSTTTTALTPGALGSKSPFFSTAVLIVIAGASVGIATCALVFALVVAVWNRKQNVKKKYRMINHLDNEAEDYEDRVRGLKTAVEKYATLCRENKDLEDSFKGKPSGGGEDVGRKLSKKSAQEIQDINSEFMSKWYLFRDKHDKFIADYTVELQHRREVASRQHKLGVLATREGNLQRQVTLSGFWPRTPGTPANVIRLQRKELQDLNREYKELKKEFKKLEKQVFPEGLGIVIEDDAALDYEFTTGKQLPDLKAEVELLKLYSHPLLSNVTAMPYGILGVGEGQSDPTTGQAVNAVVVDPAGWEHISEKNKPTKATGASGSIYAWLGIRQKGKFPPEVHNFFKAPYEEAATGLSKFHTYREGQHVIHHVPPKLVELIEGHHDLCRAYLSIFTEFCEAIRCNNTVPQKLRLAPISSTKQWCKARNIYRHMPDVQWSAMAVAFCMLPSCLQQILSRTTIEVCIFKRRDFTEYERKLNSRKQIVSSKPKLDDARGSVSQKVNFDWVRHKNSPTDRLERLYTMLVTEHAVLAGGYILNDGRTITISSSEMVKDTRVNRATEPPHGSLNAHRKTKISLNTPDCPTVMEAAIGCAEQGKKTVAVNAASAYSVGGGAVTGGRHALEETWCVTSSLLKSLQKAQWDMIGPHQHASSEISGQRSDHAHQHIPVDGCIVSPGIEIFRDTSAYGYAFQSKGTKLLGVCSVAMFNNNPRMRDSPQDAPKDFEEYRRLVKVKFRTMMVAAAELGAQVLVCPDVGCGVFENDPQIVGALFGEVIHELPGLIEEVVITGKITFYEAARRAARGENMDSFTPSVVDQPRGGRRHRKSPPPSRPSTPPSMPGGQHPHGRGKRGRGSKSGGPRRFVQRATAKLPTISFLSRKSPAGEGPTEVMDPQMLEGDSGDDDLEAGSDKREAPPTPPCGAVGHSTRSTSTDRGSPRGDQPEVKNVPLCKTLPTNTPPPAPTGTVGSVSTMGSVGPNEAGTSSDHAGPSAGPAAQAPHSSPTLKRPGDQY